MEDVKFANLISYAVVSQIIEKLINYPIMLQYFLFINFKCA